MSDCSYMPTHTAKAHCSLDTDAQSFLIRVYSFRKPVGFWVISVLLMLLWVPEGLWVYYIFLSFHSLSKHPQYHFVSPYQGLQHSIRKEEEHDTHSDMAVFSMAISLTRLLSHVIPWITKEVMGKKTRRKRLNEERGGGVNNNHLFCSPAIVIFLNTIYFNQWKILVQHNNL